MTSLPSIASLPRADAVGGAGATTAGTPHLSRDFFGLSVRGKTTLVDTADLEIVMGHRWYLNSGGYVVRKIELPDIGWRDLALHRELLGLTYGDGLQVDHINRDRLDNRRSNLRVVSRAEQNQNRDGWGRSGVRGVSWHKGDQLWHVRVRLNGAIHYGGRFDDLNLAAQRASELRARLLPFSEDAA